MWVAAPGETLPNSFRIRSFIADALNPVWLADLRVRSASAIHTWSAILVFVFERVLMPTAHARMFAQSVCMLFHRYTHLQG